MVKSIVVSALARDGDRDSDFDAIYRQHYRRVFLLASRYTAGDRLAAEDLAHDAFLKLFQHLSELDDLEDIGGWLYRVTANLGVSRLRAYMIRVRLGLLWWKHPGGELDQESPLELVADANKALGALHILPVRERVVLCMKYLDGLSQRDIAAALGISEPQVCRLVKRGVERLRRNMGVPHE